MGPCLGTDGSTNWIQWPSTIPAAKLVTPLTVFVRVYIPAWNGTASVISSDDSNGVWLIISGRSLVYRIGGSSIFSWATGFTTTADGCWVTISVSDSAKAQTLYCNGVPVATSATTTTSPTAAGTMFFGTRGTAHTFIDSLIYHDAALWNRVLTDREHWLIANDPTWGFLQPNTRRFATFGSASFISGCLGGCQLGGNGVTTVTFPTLNSGGVLVGGTNILSFGFTVSTSSLGGALAGGANASGFTFAATTASSGGCQLGGLNASDFGVTFRPYSLGGILVGGTATLSSAYVECTTQLTAVVTEQDTFLDERWSTVIQATSQVDPEWSTITPN
jgi:hypothetical protein